jgi:hypothetical protein
MGLERLRDISRGTLIHSLTHSSWVDQVQVGGGRRDLQESDQRLEDESAGSLLTSNGRDRRRNHRRRDHAPRATIASGPRGFKHHFAPIGTDHFKMPPNLVRYVPKRVAGADYLVKGNQR